MQPEPLFTGACAYPLELVGGFLILGGWAALKVLPWLELVLSGQSG